jgi:hypothetical protein
MALYGKAKQSGEIKVSKSEMSDIMSKPFKELTDSEMEILDNIKISVWDLIQANSGGHKCITNISGINFIYRSNKKDPRLDDIPQELLPIATYSGDDTFLKDIKEKLLKWGKLSDRQIEVAMSKIQKTSPNIDETPKKTYVELVKQIQNKFVEILRRYVEQGEEVGELGEGWSEKYKKSIDCNNPKGFSQKAHCQGRKKQDLDEYARTLKMARRQGVGVRFPKSAVDNSPNRFRPYNR